MDSGKEAYWEQGASTLLHPLPESYCDKEVLHKIREEGKRLETEGLGRRLGGGPRGVFRWHVRACYDVPK